MLKNPKWELFAQSVAKGVNATEAAVSAGFAAKRACVTGSELLAREEIKGRVTELKARITQKVTDSLGIDKAWVMSELVEIVKLGKTGEPILDEDGKLTGEYKAAQNLAAANKALELIGKEFSMFVDKKEIRTGPLDGVEHDDLKEIGEALAALAATEKAQSAGPGGTVH